MSLYLQIELQPFRLRSKFPFDPLSTLKIGNYIFPYNYIESLSITTDSRYFPLYIGLLGKSYMKVFDSRKTLISTIHISALRDSTGATGADTTATLSSGDPLALYAFINTICLTGPIILEPNTLIIHSQCIHLTLFPKCRSIFINAVKYHGYVKVLLKDNLIIRTSSTSNSEHSTHSIHAYGKPSAELINGSSKEPLRYINDVDLALAHLIIKPNALSDLRVETTSELIIFKGVRDAKSTQ